jgi:predicted metal-dependent hydrolase
MAGTIFFRERTKVEEGEKKPRFSVVAIAGADVKFKSKHVRRNELEQIATAVGAELVELKVEGKGHKLTDAG